MCYPAIGAIIAVVSAAGTAWQQSDQQRRQVNYRNRVTKVTEETASKAADSDYAAIAERVVQTRQSAAEEAYDSLRQSRMADASLTAGANAAGMSGGVVGDLRATLAIQAADNVALRERQASWEEDQIMRSLVNIQTQQMSRLNATMSGPIAGINYGQLLGTLGSAATDLASPDAFTNSWDLRPSAPSSSSSSSSSSGTGSSGTNPEV